MRIHWATWIGLGALTSGVLACAGVDRSLEEPEAESVQAERDDEVGEAMSQLGGTELDEQPAPLASVAFGEGGGSFDVGGGVQVLQVSPLGEGRRAVQASVVFDRPVVPLSDLDSMAEGAPLSCSPDVGARARWAGTSTAVLVPPDGAFRDATHFTCTVGAGLRAVDGSTLEKALTFEFDTPRPHVLRSTPYDGAEQVRPDTEIELVFDQPVDPEVLKPYLSIDGGKVAIRSVKGGDQPTRLVLTAGLEKARHYALTVRAGATSMSGPLPMQEDWTLEFDTYPPFEVLSSEPSGTTSANAWLEMQFSTEVSRAEVSEHLTISPRPPTWKPSSDDDWPSQWWSYGVALTPRTDYTLTLDADTEDEHGQKLGKPYVWRFRSTDFDPSGNFPTGFKVYPAKNPPALPYKHLNLSDVDLRGVRFSPSALTSPDKWDDLVEKAVATAGRAPVDLDPTPNRTELDSWDFRSLLDEEGHGWIGTRFTSPELVDYRGERREYTGLWVVTDLGGTVKMGPRATEVWVTTLSTGEPVSDVQVIAHDGGKVLGTASTGSDGLARIHASIHGSGWDRKAVWFELKKGKDDGVVVSRWGPEGWSWIDDDGFAMRSTGWADRGVYRLGDPVHAYALFRRADEEGLVLPKGSVTWNLRDPEGEIVASGAGVLNARGGISIDTVLPKDGMLGNYEIGLSASGPSWSRYESIQVPARAYRPPAFRVTVSAPEQGVVGDPLSATLDARYLFGAEMSRGEVTWRAWTTESRFSPKGWDGWSFGSEPRWWWDEPESSTTDLPNVSGPLAEQRTWSQTLKPDTIRDPVRLSVEAEVTDVDRQVIAGHDEIEVHPGSLYAGLHPKSMLPVAGQATSIEVVAVDLEGKAVSGAPVKVTLVKRTTDSVREKGLDGHWSWVNTTTDTEVAKTTLTSGGSAQSWSVTPTAPGRHVLIATVTDSAGREVRTESSLWVVGKGYASWGRRDDGQMGLVLERSTVAPGETARMLVQAPLPDLWAWVTVEREGVLWRKVVKLEGNAAAVDIPTQDAWLPGVTISVVAVTGAGPQDAPDKGRPEAYFGRTELTVDSTREHLAVAVKPAREVYRPRDKVDVEIAVQRDGAPAAGAGVVLYAVDEAILSLTAYQTPDAFAEMYASHGRNVATADARWEVLDRAPFLTKGAKIGGGGADMGEGGPAVRNRFVTTITWQPDLVTGPDGKVKASFELPDNLTAFRIMAVADQGAVSFGSGEQEIRVTRPLVVRPALPRLMREGDQAFAGVVVHNDTDDVRWVEVSAAVKGPVEVTGTPFGLDIPPRTSVEVPFHLKALEAGRATFTFRADSNDDHDGVEVPLEVGRDVVIETTATAGLVDGKWTEQIARPDGARPGFGGLSVDLASTALVGTTDGLSYLLDYPYGCIEQ
ncbi:MAG: Ig-like domain-containing protein, partial [Myxococcales bacterium]|nr:Ig-like domain-containing protein [Myxococcales bacterium]